MSPPAKSMMTLSTIPTITPGDPCLPRIDTLIENPSTGERRVLAGIPTLGATVSNLAGVATFTPSYPGGFAVVAYIHVSPGSTEVRDSDVAPNLHTIEINDAVSRIESEIASG